MLITKIQDDDAIHVCIQTAGWVVLGSASNQSGITQTPQNVSHKDLTTTVNICLYCYFSVVRWLALLDSRYSQLLGPDLSVYVRLQTFTIAKHRATA